MLSVEFPPDLVHAAQTMLMKPRMPGARQATHSSTISRTAASTWDVRVFEAIAAHQLQYCGYALQFPEQRLLEPMVKLHYYLHDIPRRIVSLVRRRDAIYRELLNRSILLNRWRQRFGAALTGALPKDGLPVHFGK